MGLVVAEGEVVEEEMVTEGLLVAEEEEPAEVEVPVGAAVPVVVVAAAGSGMAAFLMVKRAEYDCSGELTRMEYLEPEATVVGTLTVREPALAQSRLPREGTPGTGSWTPSARSSWSMTGKAVVAPVQVLVQEMVAS